MKLNILFWNLNKKNLAHSIGKIVDCEKINIVTLVENNVNPDDILKELRLTDKSYFHAKSIGQSKVYIFTSIPVEYISPVHDENRLALRLITVPNKEPILLGIIHFPDKMNFSESSQLSEAFELSNKIDYFEKKCNCINTVLLGDFNMNPFEDGMINANAFNATSDRSVALKLSRTVQGNDFRFFYNPMWNMFGDQRDGPPGTYYYERAEHKNYFWNILDQVIIRPSLIPHFEYESLSILNSCNEFSLISENGYPDNKKFSDHLPIKFSLIL